jgi:hypothetical protein
MPNRTPVFLALLCGELLAQIPPPGRGGPSGILPSRQSITPAGVHTTFSEPVYGVSFGAHPDELWVLIGANDTRDGHGRLTGIEWRKNRRILDRPLAGTMGIQGVVFDRVAGRAIAPSPRAPAPAPGKSPCRGRIRSWWTNAASPRRAPSRASIY